MRQDVESFNDFCQYYSGSFVKGRQPDELYLVHGKMDDKHIILIRYAHGRKQDSVTSDWNDIQTRILFGLPRMGMVAYRNELMFFFYKTTRDGSRGYDPDRISWRSFNQWDLRQLDIETADSDVIRSPVFIHNLLRHSHVQWHDAMADLLAPKPKALAVSLSFNFGAYITASHPHPLLCYKSERIGSIVGPNTIQLHDPELNHYKGVIRKWVNPSMEFQV